MAIAVKSNENSEGRKKFVGYENFYVEAINPSLEKTKALGYNFKKDPVYLSKKDGEPDSIRIDFFLSNRATEESGKSPISLVHSYYLEKSNVESKTGKTQYTNAYGAFTWLEDPDNIPENMSWFSTEGLRPALVGEELLMDFVKNFANVSKGDVCSLDKVDSYFNAGDVTELRQLVQSVPNNTIRINLTIKKVYDEEKGVEKFYQSSYTRKTERPYSTDASYMKASIDEFIENSSSASSIIFAPYPYSLQEFTGIVPDEAEVPTAAPSW